MIKFLFFDYRLIESVEGFTRELRPPAKHPENPFFIANDPWENGNMQLYGSVVKAPDRPFQLWYSVIHAPFTIYLAYAESDDGIEWRKPKLDIFEFKGEKTNIVFAKEPHGAAIIYDEAEPDPEWRYKMMCGASPSHAICAHHSADGIDWKRISRFPVITTGPDCPMGFLRAADGRYAAYHRLAGYGRRVFRSESHDLRFWSSEPRLVVEPDCNDPPQTQFYGMGSTAYGPYEIGTLWMYHTDVEDTGPGKMGGYQEAELTFSRSGYAWHRVAQGVPFIPHGGPEEWDRGNLQCASAPVFVEDEIRYYYMGTTQRHKTYWELDPQEAGLGMARMKPDRFVALCAGDEPAALTTVSWTPTSPALFVNARIASNGYVKIGFLEANGAPIEGLALDDCAPAAGDGTALAIGWKSGSGVPVDRPVRLQVEAQNADLYSIYTVDEGETPCYWRFRSPRPGW